MKKKISILLSGLGFFASLMLFNVNDASAIYMDMSCNNGKALAQGSEGGYCCANLPDNDCTQSPDC